MPSSQAMTDPLAMSPSAAPNALSDDGRPLVDDPVRLAALEELEILDTPPERAFDDIVVIVAALCDAPIALLSLVDRERQWLKAKVGLDIEEAPLDQSVCACGIGSEELLVIPDLTRDPRTRDNPLVVPADGIRFYAGAPLVTKGGEVVGMLCAIDKAPRPAGLTSVQEKALAALARQTMTLMELRHVTHVQEIELRRREERGLESRTRAVRSERARRKLERASRSQRRAQVAGRIGTFVLDVATNTLQVSPEFCQLYGVPEAETYPASVFEALTIPEDRHLRSNIVSRADGSATPDVEYRIVRPSDGQLRWIARRAAFERDETGKVVRMAGTVHDVTQRRIANDRMASLVELGDGLRHARTAEEVERLASGLLGTKLDASRVGYGIVDRTSGHLSIRQDWTDGHTSSAAGVYDLRELGATIGLLGSGESIVVEDVTRDPRLAPDVAFYRAKDVCAQIVVPLFVHGDLEGMLFVHSASVRSWPVRDIAFVEGVADRAHAVLAQLRAEADQAVLNHELGHRLKNTLAMAASIASQTLRNVTERDAVDAFQKRLIALGKAHDVLLQGSWAAARIRTVVEGALSIFGAGARVMIDGPNLTVGPRAALSLALVIHELGTNAVKYGALSNADGHVLLDWRVETEGEEPVLRLRWWESGGPPAAEPTRRGFGSRLIGMGLTGAGGVTMRYLPAGLEAEFVAPLKVVQAG